MNADLDAFAEESKQIQEASSGIVEKVRNLYPQLLIRNNALTDSDWVLDSGCGYGLTADRTRVVKLQWNQEYAFMFAEGTKHTDTHVGTIKLFLKSRNGIVPFYFNDVALVPNAKSNIISEYWLNRKEYQIIESTKGEYKYILNDNSLAFVAIAVEGVYYIQHQNLK